MQRWVPLLVASLLVLAAGGWFAFELACGDKTQEPRPAGQEPAPTECAKGNLFPPTLGLTVTLAWLGGGLLAFARPITRTGIDTGVLRTFYWPLLALFCLFVVMELDAIGLYLFPLAIVLLILALWPDDSGPWAVGAGAVLCVLGSILMLVGELYAVRTPLNAPEEHVVMPWWSLYTLLGSGVVGAAGARFWPRWWSYLMFVPALGAAWTSLFLPENPQEALYFALPGVALVTLGVVRCVVGSFQHRPEKQEKPLYPELEEKPTS